MIHVIHYCMCCTVYSENDAPLPQPSFFRRSRRTIAQLGSMAWMWQSSPASPIASTNSRRRGRLFGNRKMARGLPGCSGKRLTNGGHGEGASDLRRREGWMGGGVRNEECARSGKLSISGVRLNNARMGRALGKLSKRNLLRCICYKTRT